MKRFLKWLFSMPPCKTEGCNNAQFVFGLCEDCAVKRWSEADRRESEREHAKLKTAVREVVREILAETKKN